MKPVRIVWRNSYSFSLKGPKSNFGDVLRVSFAANDLRYRYLFCLDQRSRDLFKLLFANLSIISFEDLKKINFENNYLFTMEDSIYTLEMKALINKCIVNNCHKQIKVANPYERKALSIKSWQETFAHQLDINIKKIQYSYAKPRNFKRLRINNLVGINYLVPIGWESKRPSDKWIDSLNKALLSLKYDVSNQPKPTSLRDYIEWINSCNILITVEGLGLHIGLALRKKVILLSGPVNRTEHLVDNLRCLSVKESQKCKLCKKGEVFSPNCQCMDTISLDEVINNI